MNTVELGDIILIHGDCLEVMDTLPENSVDTCITDNPYELGFMGKGWDASGISFQKETWEKVLRVLKPGGMLLAFGGTRTFHRIVCAIEDAGFEIRDTVMYIYGSGFPKSLSISKSLDKREQGLWSNISKGIDKLDKNAIIQVWKNNLSDAMFVGTQYQKNLIEGGINTSKSDFAQESVLLNISPERYYADVIIVELSSGEVQPCAEENILTAQENANQNITQLQSNVRFVEKQLQDQKVNPYTNTFIVQCNVRDMLKESSAINHRVEEALKIYYGNLKFLSEQDISVLCAKLTEDLKLIILNQSKTFQNLGTTQQTECAYATTVIITKSIMECLISFTVDILKSKAIDKMAGAEREVIGEIVRGDVEEAKGNGVTIAAAHANRNNKAIFGYGTEKLTMPATSEAQLWDGWGTALKPAVEPICVAMKPRDGTFAQNALKWGVAGLWIDGGRVETGEQIPINKLEEWSGFGQKIRPDYEQSINNKGRFPANLIHDGSDEVLGLFPQCKQAQNVGDFKQLESMRFSAGGVGVKPQKQTNGKIITGSAARFFKECTQDNLCSLCLTQKHGIMNETEVTPCKNISVSNVEKSSTIIRATTENTAQESVQDWLIEKAVRFVKSAGNLCDTCATSIVREVVEIKTWDSKSGGLPAIQDFIGNSRKCILIQNLAQCAEILESIDTTQITTSLSRLFGSANLAIINYIHETEKSAPKRFLYTPKASRSERNAGLEGMEGKGVHRYGAGIGEGKHPEAPAYDTNFHPTVKPIALMEYLVRLTKTPTGGVVLDPFMGSGTTLAACARLGRKGIGIEIDEAYFDIAVKRVQDEQRQMKLAF